MHQKDGISIWYLSHCHLINEDQRSSIKKMARVTRLELATSGVTGRHSNQLSYTRITQEANRLGWHGLRPNNS